MRLLPYDGHADASAASLARKRYLGREAVPKNFEVVRQRVIPGSLQSKLLIYPLAAEAAATESTAAANTGTLRKTWSGKRSPRGCGEQRPTRHSSSGSSRPTAPGTTSTSLIP